MSTERKSRLFFVIAWLISTAVGRVSDTDIYHILLEGNYVLDNHAIHRINDSSVVDGMQMIAQQYGYDIVAAMAHRSGGMWGLWAMMSGLILAAFVLSLRYISYINGRRNSNYIVASFICICGFVGAFSIRPSIATICLLLMQILFTEHYIREEKKKWLIYILLTVIAEANIHMSYIPFHAVFLLPYIVPFRSNGMVKITSTAPKQEMELFVTMLLTVPAGYVNPYGLKGCMFFLLAEPWKLKMLGIKELQPLEITNTLAWIIIAIVIMLIMLIKSESCIESRTLFGVLGCVILSCMAGKNHIFIGFALLWLFTDKNFRNTSDIIEKWSGDILRGFFCNLLYYKVIAILLIAAMLMAGFVKNIPYMKKDGPGNPVKAAEYMESERIPKTSKIFTSFNCGGLLEYRGYRVLLDPRPELGNVKINGRSDIFGIQRSFYGAETYAEKLEYYKKLVSIVNFDYAVIASDSPLVPFIENDGDWKKMFEEKDSYGIIYKNIREERL